MLGDNGNGIRGSRLSFWGILFSGVEGGMNVMDVFSHSFASWLETGVKLLQFRTVTRFALLSGFARNFQVASFSTSTFHCQCKNDGRP